MTLNELKSKYNLTNAKYEPKSDCQFCKGAGERAVKSQPSRYVPCICIFVDHEVSDEVGTSLGRLATKELARLRGK